MIRGSSRLLTAASNLALAVTYLLAWAGMGGFDAGSSVRYLGYLILMEFVQLMLGLPILCFLAGPLKGGARSRLPRGMFFAIVGTLALALGTAGAAMSFSAGAVWPMVGVVLLLTGKWDLYVRPPRTALESRRIMADAVIRLTALFFLLMPCVVLPFPAWNLPSSMEEFGDFRPAGLMVWGAAYFGLFGLFGHRLDRMVSDEPEARGSVPRGGNP